MIIKSDCRGEPRNTSAPKRDTSKRDAAKHIISMAQHARPNDIGQMELLRAQFTSLSSCVKITPSLPRNPAASSGVSSVTPFASWTDIAPPSNNSFSHFARASANRVAAAAQAFGLLDNQQQEVREILPQRITL